MQKKDLQIVEPGSPIAATQSPVMLVRAVLLGERIDTRGLERGNGAFVSPVLLRTVSGGIAFVFRYGVAVLFGLAEAEERALLDGLRQRTGRPVEPSEAEQSRVLIRPDIEEQIDAEGTITLKDASPERLQVVAHILSKSVVLGHYEAQVASVFDQTEPLAERLHRHGRTGSNVKQLLRRIGYVLITQHRMVGRVEVEEKPDVLWDHPELGRLYARLDDEYELSERSRSIERKLQLIGDTVDTLLELVQDARSLRLEYYVIALILIEVLLSGYEVLRSLL